jgi:hypothetical protein
LDDIKIQKEEMELKIIKKMVDLKADAIELDPVVPPQNEFDMDRIDLR